MLQGPDKPEDAEPPRPPWHWVGFGTVAIFVAWLPLAYLAESVSDRIVASRLPPGDAAELGERLRALSPAARRTAVVLMALPHVAALVLAALAGGFLVTRFGAGTRPREAALSGLLVGLLALGLTYAQTGVSLAPVIVPMVATLAAWGGGRLGRRAGA